jgi:hypothetical protein
VRFVFLLVLAQSCFAQLCMPEGQPQPDSPYAYIRAETKALQWIRNALTESENIRPFPPSGDPERLHKAVKLYTVAQTISDDYDCAATLLTKYKDSKNEYINASVDSLLMGIDATKNINAKLVGLIESLNEAKKPEAIDQTAIAKVLANAKGIQKDVRNLAMAGAKMSAFGVVRIEGNGDDAKPVAFTITAKQRATLVAEVQELAKKKGQGQDTYVDSCAEILLDTLTKPLPTFAQ